ncbi:glycosyltransferase [Dinghuibacter silviterrae]|uniref:Cellulose synthase/poly-beta-1,6-N-acetylglucosamine synthase-like glycosyltransferase n=1 Tax=Dinghuibacter silviterrae TaxID=1539049 RepID=A0A4R8DP32_9BACT|nr:glycosyltransferase [Dinghuibacter silviterrae]TDW99859.1 cellulose synthase/poly-beta-1,6-N-acetylglucosamine synthase-like glycosyltransferase [Dinghuibacter silviterrae]
MSKPSQIFQTDNPSRWRRVQWSTRVLLAVLVFLILILFIALARFKNPSLPLLEQQADYYQKILKPKGVITFKNSRNKAYQGFRDVLARAADSAVRNRAAAKENPFIRAAFYSPWSAPAHISLRNYAGRLNSIFPEWFLLGEQGLRSQLDTFGLNIMQRNSLKIYPVVSNFSTAKQDFDGRLVKPLLHDKEARDRFLGALKDTLLKYNFDGVNIDFEELDEKSPHFLVDFMEALYKTLHPLKKLVTIDVTPENDDYDYDKLAAWSDNIVLMAYDQHYDESIPGPVCGQKWIEEAMDQAAKDIPSGKIILGLAGYGYDWPKSGKAESISYQQALSRAQESHADIDFDNDSYNLHFTYTAKDVNENGNNDQVEDVQHEVWFTDAATNFNTIRFADEYGAAGTVLWRMGVEDTRLWTFYPYDLSNNGLRKRPFDYNSLSFVPLQWDNVAPPIGEGEILSVENMPQEGKIRLEVDSAENLITEQHYLQLPVSFLIRRFGEDTSEVHRKMILTFDDGPDPRWTPEIIDILQKENVPAAFFVVGINAEKNIPILREEYKLGYEIGNHTFTHGNIALMGPRRAELEMKLTRLLIECVTGRSTILFRPPYNADSEPHTFEELMPIARSKKDNYYTVGEAIDPEDWEPGVSADSIYARVVRVEAASKGSIILLHDAGGTSRQATVEALPRIIHYFKVKGYHFTTVSDLMGKTYADVMPVLPKSKDTWMVEANYYLASFTYWTGEILFILFLVGIGLSLARMFMMLIMAFYQKKREKTLEEGYRAVAASWLTNGAPLVSIVIPAYNEEVNAVKTIESLLEQDYPNYNILFVDDGSKDETFARVSAAFADNPKVRAVTKPNGGKASALNYGIHITEAEFIVCIDADTQLKTDAVSELMQRFTHEDVGAVAGNVKVGNERNLLTYWQSIEYITAQNFDRRAFDLLNCITVVPGAIGAFRRSAMADAGFFTTDTLAEDCDLTMRLLRKGYIVRNCATALSYTEAPETLGMFLKQRFRWSYGVMQCFWKHRDALCNNRYKAFGWVALPNILIFQILLPFLAPLADLILVLSLIAAGFGFVDASTWHIVIYYIVFTFVDVLGASLAFAFERENPKKLLWMLPQRLVYRQLMYYILLRSLRQAVKGQGQGWGRLKRTGNVNVVRS